MVIIDKSNATDPIEGQLFRITFCFFLLAFLLTNYSWQEYLVLLAAGSIAFISYRITGRDEVVRFVVFVAACRGREMQKVLKVVFWVTLVGMGAIILLSVTGIYGVPYITAEYRPGVMETRYTLGMGHPNALQCMLWALTTLWIYLWGEKKQIIGYLAALGLNIGLFFLTDSKTGILIIVPIIVYAWLILGEQDGMIAKILGALGILGTMFSVALSVFCAVTAHYTYEYRWSTDLSRKAELISKLDRILNGRIGMLVDNERWEGSIGTWLLWSEPANNYYFDMGWVRLFYWYGIIPATLCVIVLLLVMGYCLKKKEYAAIVMITSFAFYSIMEAHAISVYLARNYVLFLVAAYWWQMVPGRTLQKKENNTF